MRIIRFEAENIKRLKAVAIDPTGKVVQITGENGSGKSSVLDSIMYALFGASAAPDMPIRDGEARASITLDLGDEKVAYTVRRRFTQGGGTSLIVESPEGAQYKSPQGLLDRMLGALTFDPLEFSRLEPKKRVELFRKVVKVDLDIDEQNRKSAELYSTRTETNRRLTEFTERAKGLREQVDASMIELEPIDTDALVGQMQAAIEENGAIQRAEQLREEKRHKLELYRADSQRQWKIILDLKAKYEETDALIESLQTEIEAEDDSDEPAPIPRDTTAIRSEISAAQQENERRRAQRVIREQLAEAERNESTLDHLAKAATHGINAIRLQIERAIAEAEMPVPGLSFGEGEITYNGIPFAQASTAEQIRVSTAIAIALNPKLRIISIKDGSLLDSKSLAIIAEMAEQHNVQVWIERVSVGAPVGFEMVDGEVASVDGVPVPPSTEASEAE